MHPLILFAIVCAAVAVLLLGLTVLFFCWGWFWAGIFPALFAGGVAALGIFFTILWTADLPPGR